MDPAALPAEALEFLRERHLATLSTLRPDGTCHVVPVGLTWDDEAHVARVITAGGSRKARNVAAGGVGARAVLCQVEGWRWLTLEGPARVRSDAEAVSDAVARYTVRYRPPRENPLRVVIEVRVDRVLGLVHRRPSP